MKDNLLFDINHLSNYAIVKEPCTIIVKCNSKLDFNNLYTADGYFRWLVNLKAISSKNLKYVKKMTSLKIDLDYNFIGPLLMTGAIWERQANNPMDLPTKGEDVIATFDYVEDKLMCIGITIIPRIKPELFTPYADILKEIETFKKMKDE